MSLGGRNNFPGGVQVTKGVPAVRSFSRDIKPQETITATLAVTEADDTLVSTASVLVSANAAITEANDTVASTASVLVSATAAITEAADTVVSTASVLVTATSSITEAADTLASTVGVLVSSTASLTEANDSLSSTTAVVVASTAAITEAADSVTSTATVLVSTQASPILEDDDSVDATAEITQHCSLLLVDGTSLLLLVNGVDHLLLEQLCPVEPPDVTTFAGKYWKVKPYVAPKAIQVESSTISEVAYDKASNELKVKFNSGREYNYTNISEKKVKGLIKAKSSGKYLHNNIKGKYFTTRTK